MTALEDQLRAGPEATLALLTSAVRPLSSTGPLHWHGLAEGAAQNAGSAFDAGDGALGLAWARTAVGIYDALAADVVTPHAFDLSSMNVRVRAIRSAGSRSGDAVLDPDVIVSWARAALVCGVDEAVARSEEFFRRLAAGVEPSVDDARILRKMKNRLRVLARLAEELPLPADLGPWLDARNRLV